MDPIAESACQSVVFVGTGPTELAVQQLLDGFPKQVGAAKFHALAQQLASFDLVLWLVRLTDNTCGTAADLLGES